MYGVTILLSLAIYYCNRIAAEQSIAITITRERSIAILCSSATILSHPPVQM